MSFVLNVSPVNSGERELEHEEKERLVSERPLRASTLAGASMPVTSNGPLVTFRDTVPIYRKRKS